MTIYVCGVTPYNYCHVGNARPYVVWDVIRRYLEYKGYKVFHVQNFTDVDDKIIARAAEEGVTPGEIAEKYIAEYFDDMDALGSSGPISIPGLPNIFPILSRWSRA